MGQSQKGFGYFLYMFPIGLFLNNVLKQKRIPPKEDNHIIQMAHNPYGRQPEMEDGLKIGDQACVCTNLKKMTSHLK